MKQRWIVVLWAVTVFLAGAARTSQAFPELPGLPSLGGAPQPWFSTSLNDAVTDAPFLDAYDPSYMVPLQEMPRGLNDEFLLGPGAYELWAESYCLTPGAHSPGSGGHGDGYAYAPGRGKGAPVLQAILHRAALHPEIEQHDIQVLIWALIAQTPYDQLNPHVREVAEKMLDKGDLDKLEQAAQARQAAEALGHLSGYLPGPVQQILNAESTLRGMFSGAMRSYGDIEAIAVAAGDAVAMKGDREIKTGRWSYNPDGYFVSFIPHGYSQTLVEVCIPGKLRIGIDKHGRVTRVADQSGNSVETVYDDKVYGVPGEPGLTLCPFKTVRLRKIIPWRPDAPITLEVSGQGYAVVGVPQGNASPPAGQGVLSTLPDRYAWTARHARQMEALTAAICKINKRPDDAKARKNMIPVLVNLGGWAHALRDVVAQASSGGQKPDFSLVNPAFEAWQAAVVTFGDAAKKPGTAFETGGARVATSGMLAGDFDFDEGPRQAPKWLKPYDPAPDISQPGDQSRQRLGSSSRPSRSPNRPPNRRDQTDDSWRNKDILAKARECMSYIEGLSDLANLFDDPAQFAIGKATDVQGGVKDAMFDWMFNTAAEISQQLGGDPPRSDFSEVTLPARVDIQALCQGMKQLPSPDGLLATTLELDAVLQAAQIARDRLGGAVAAKNADGVYRQGLVLIELKRRAGLLWVRVADRLDEVARRVEARNILVTPEVARSWRARLKANGFGKADLEAARRLGVSPERIEAMRQHYVSLADTPFRRPLSDTLRDVAAAYRKLGEMWSCLPAVEGLGGKS